MLASHMVARTRALRPSLLPAPGVCTDRSSSRLSSVGHKCRRERFSPCTPMLVLSVHPEYLGGLFGSFWDEAGPPPCDGHFPLCLIL